LIVSQASPGKTLQQKKCTPQVWQLATDKSCWEDFCFPSGIQQIFKWITESCKPQRSKGILFSGAMHHISPPWLKPYHSWHSLKNTSLTFHTLGLSFYLYHTILVGRFVFPNRFGAPIDFRTSLSFGSSETIPPNAPWAGIEMATKQWLTTNAPICMNFDKQIPKHVLYRNLFGIKHLPN